MFSASQNIHNSHTYKIIPDRIQIEARAWVLYIKTDLIHILPYQMFACDNVNILIEVGWMWMKALEMKINLMQ